MCGIFGRLNFTRPLGEADLNRCRAARDSLVHRGPDGAGEWHSDHLYFGHRRLSIIDLREIAGQPFFSDDQRYVLVFNGEIYNYVELRKELEQAGHVFRTDSDTEVLLKGLITWGLEGLNKLDGMFAGALHDTVDKTLHLFRDPLGQKPLYLFHDADQLVFSSELAPVIHAESRDWRINKTAFYSYLTHAYYPWDLTPVEGVTKVLPGGLVTVKDGQVSQKRWWNSVPGQKPLDIGFGEAAKEFERLLDRSCMMSMRADVPVGVFLSGGLDSSAVMSSCHKAIPNVHAFSVSMSEADYDESAKAKLAVQHEGIEHHTLIEMSEPQLLECFSALMQHMDEPHADPGFVNAYFLSREARKHITVAIAGDGADELLCGYAPFKGVPIGNKMGMVPGFLVKAMKGLVPLLPSSDGYVGLQFKARAFLQGYPSTELNRPSAWLATLPPEELSALLPQTAATAFDATKADSLFAIAGAERGALMGQSFTQQLLYYYQQLFLPEFVCHHTDRAAMMHSLEVRAPFLSRELIDFCNRLPDDFKMQNGNLKRILRQLLIDRNYPAEITAQKKQGFTFPLARWLKHGMREMVEGLTDIESVTDGLVDNATFKGLVDEHFQNKKNNYRIIYALLVFQQWHKRFPEVRF